MNKQQKYDKLYLDIAKRVSEMSYAERKKVGAVIVKDGNIISFGWNGTIPNAPNECEDEHNITLPMLFMPSKMHYTNLLEVVRVQSDLLFTSLYLPVSLVH